MFNILIIFLSILNLYFFFSRKSKRKVFQEVFNCNIQPSCVIDNLTNEILWINDTFKLNFENIRIGDNFKKLDPKYILSNIQVNKKNTEWLLKNIYLSEGITGIVFLITNRLQIDWWIDIPFPAALISVNNEIIKSNSLFRELIEPNSTNISDYSKEFNLQIIEKENGQEILWKTSKGLHPIKTYVVQNEANKVIFLENRIEFIKLKNKAQESQHLKILGQLTSNIIHDFNNILTCICGFAESLNEKLPDDENLIQIKRNIEQASELSKELLNFIKEKPLEDRIIEPKTIIPKMVRMLTRLLGSNIKVSYNLNTNGYIKITETQLEQIILNMAINSKDAMPKGGSFKINSYIQTFANSYKIHENKKLKPGDYYTLEISDSGCGIPIENIKKIFSPFFTTKIKGTGLGLASCLRIAEHNGGSIQFSTSSQGTIFTLFFPIINQENSHNNVNIHETKNSMINDTKLNPNIKKRIVLVEDEEIVKNLMKKSLNSDYEIIDFSTGDEAIVYIKNNDFDCLVTDAVLPGIDGIQLIKTTQMKNSNIKIVLVSGYNFETLKKDLPNNIHYVEKPFTLKNLKQKISEIL